MVEPVRVTGQRAIQLKVSDEHASHPDDIKAMFALARREFGVDASLKNFEFRLKERGGERFLELREQSWFGRLREKWDSRLHDRLSERRMALAKLKETFGEGLMQRLNIMDGLSPNRVQARAIVQHLDNAVLQGPAIEQLQEEGFPFYEAAAQFVDNKINFIKASKFEDLQNLTGLLASALEQAVYADPSILDEDKSSEERAEMFAPHEQAFYDRLVKSEEDKLKATDDPDERAGVQFELDYLPTKRPAVKENDLKILNSPEQRNLLKETIGKGKQAGLRLKDIVLLTRTSGYNLVKAADPENLKDLLRRVYDRELLTDSETKTLKQFFLL